MTKTEPQLKKWQNVRLGDIARVSGGKRLPKGHSLQDQPTTHPYIRIVDMSQDGIHGSEMQYVTESTHEKILRYTVDAGDLYITIAGTIGWVGQVPEYLHGANLTENAARISAFSEEVDPNYILYFLKSSRGKHEIASRTTGSSQPKLPLYQIEGIQIPLPDLETQKRIADVLSAFDDKIEVNNRINEALEQMAQAFFKEWFVKNQNANSKTQKLSDFGKVICGKTPSKKESSYFGGEIPFIKVPDMHNSLYVTNTQDSLTHAGAESQKNKYIPQNSICVSCIATVGLVALASEKSQTNQQINTVVPAEGYYTEFLYFSLKRMSGYLNAIGSSGSATKNINTNTFSNIEIVIPEDKLLKEFHIKTKYMFEKIRLNAVENQKLAEARDALLPKLMSGEIKI